MGSIVKFLFFVALFVASLDAFSYNSSWVNKNLNTKNIKAVYVNSGGTVRVLGYCNGKRCDWGSAKYTRIPNGIIASWRDKKVGHKVITVVSTGDNEVQVVSKHLSNGLKRDVTNIGIFQSGNIQNISAKATMPEGMQQRVKVPSVETVQPIQPPSQMGVAPTVAPSQPVTTVDQAPTPISNDSYLVGKWLGDDPFDRSITRMKISIGRDGMFASVWGRGSCYPKECNWGRHKLMKVGDSYVSRWMQGSIDKTIEIDGIYKDQNGRFRMVRVKTTSRLKRVKGPKFRTSYLKKIQ